jgi:hypothetical protein
MIKSTMEIDLLGNDSQLSSGAKTDKTQSGWGKLRWIVLGVGLAMLVAVVITVSVILSSGQGGSSSNGSDYWSQQSSAVSSMNSNKDEMSQSEESTARRLIGSTPVTSGTLVFDFWFGSSKCSATEASRSDSDFPYGEYGITLGACLTYETKIDKDIVFHYSEMISSCETHKDRVTYSHERWNNTDCSGAPIQSGKLFAPSTCAAVPKNSTDLVSGYATCVASTPASRMLRGQRELVSVATTPVLSLIKVVHQ